MFPSYIPYLQFNIPDKDTKEFVIPSQSKWLLFFFLIFPVILHQTVVFTQVTSGRIRAHICFAGKHVLSRSIGRGATRLKTESQSRYSRMCQGDVMAEEKFFGENSFHMREDKYTEIFSISLFTITKFHWFTDRSYINALHKSIRLCITMHRWTMIH